MAGIEIRGLTRAFRDQARALDGIDLDVAGGELLVLVGPSGSGKTTLLRLLAGLDQPTQGTIRLEGKDLEGVPPHKRNVALVFQNLALYSHLTVVDNLAFGLKHITAGCRPAGGGKTAGQIPSEVREAAMLFDIDHLLDRFPSELSGGEQQRVALSRAVVRRPAALLLDEPLSSLDAPLRRSLRRELKRLQRQLGMPTIYVTHDQAEALAMGDRIGVLDQGRLQQVANPHEIYHRPVNRFVAEFFGPQGMNLIEGEMERRNGVEGLCGDSISVVVPSKYWPDALIDGDVLLGFRPEDVELVPAEAEADCSGVGNIEFVEEVGDVAYLHVRAKVHEQLPTTIDADSIRIVIRLPEKLRDCLPRVGDGIHWHFRPDCLHWFDATTGNRLL